jgi:hypothetical protein
MSSSSSDTDDSDYLVDEPVLTASSKNKKKTEGFGEGNLKGFATAFNTIMSRPAETIQEDMEETAARAMETLADSLSERKEKPIMLAHVTEPLLGSVCEKEIGLEGVARRGVVKLFRAVAMHRRRQIEHEKGLGIGVDKSGRRRRLIRRNTSTGSIGDDKSTTTTTTTTTSSGTTNMAAFLENLKAQKSRRTE